MTDITKAIAAARGALAKRDELAHRGNRLRAEDRANWECAQHLRVLLAALDAQVPVAWQWRRKGQPWVHEYTFLSPTYATTDDSEVRELFATPPAAVPADFTEWLAREMPAGTVIGDPQWWANMIARRFAQFAAPAQQPAAAVPEVLPPLPNPCHVHNVGGRIAYSWTADVVTRYAQSAMLAAAERKGEQP